MAFTTAQQAAIKAYVLDDPDGIGFADLVLVPNYAGIAVVLNWIRDGVTPCPVNSVTGTAVTIFRNDVAAREVINAIAPADFTAGTQIIISKLTLMLQAAPLDLTLANVRANMQGIFSGASATTTNALAVVAQRKGSALEKLLSKTGVTIEGDEVAYILTH